MSTEFDPTVSNFDPTESAGFDPTEGEQEIELDFSDVDPERPKFPVGKNQEAVIIGFEQAISKVRGTPSLRLTWQNDKGSRLWQDLYLSPGAMWNTGKVLTAIGLPPQGGKIKVSASKVIGRRALLDVEMEKYNGKSNPKVKVVNAHPKGPKEDAPF